jgi:hypothetical protein
MPPHARLIEQAAADQVEPVQLSIVPAAGVFGCGSSRGPQYSVTQPSVTQPHAVLAAP